MSYHGGGGCAVVVDSNAARTSNTGSSKSIWQIEKLPLKKGMLGVAVSAESPTDVWVVGNSSLHFDGKAWTQIPVVTRSQPLFALNSVAAVGPANVWAVGAFNNDKGFQNEVVEHFDGKKWSVFPDVNLVGKQLHGFTVLSETLVSITALSANDIWAAGCLLAQSAGGDTLTVFIEHFDGKKWHLSGNPAGTGNDVMSGTNGISAVSDNDVWVVAFNDANGQDGQGEAFHFDGKHWSMVQTPTVAASTLRAVTAVASDDVWAVGDRNDLHNTLVEHFDGKRWSVVPSPTPEPVINDLEMWGVAAISGKDVWASGFRDINTPPVILHWDGLKWSLNPAPSGPGSTTTFGVAALAPGQVWVSGSFFTPLKFEPFVLFTNKGQ
jgi:hypothetical protein